MTPVFGVVGHPVAQSRSPSMHAAWFAYAGLPGAYHAFEIAPDTSGDALISAIRTLGLAGVNLTVPFKERVVPHLDAIAPIAERIGAVNTIVRRDGTLWGTNTDAPGFLSGLAEMPFDDSHDRRAVVIGAGGAGRAVVFALSQAGWSGVLLNRTVARAERVVADVVGWSAAPLDAFTLHAPNAGVFAVASAKSADPVIARLDPSVVRAGSRWVDLNYGPGERPLFRRLAQHGVSVQDGLSMLIHQGALAFRAFTGHPAPIEVARSALGVGEPR